MKEILNSFEYLPRLSEFVKVCDTKNAINDTPITLMEFICQYTDFITQPPTKGMFIPCDEEGNVLEEPKRIDYIGKEMEFTKDELVKRDSLLFQQAKERVLFELPNPFKANRKKENMKQFFDKFKTIEAAINAGVKLKRKG